MANNTALDCLSFPMIGVSGACGYEGNSGLSLDLIGISLKRAANVAQDEKTGAELLEKIERAAFAKVINDLKQEISKEYTFTPVFDTVRQVIHGEKDICNTFAKVTPIGLRFEAICHDFFRKTRIDWIELRVDAEFTVDAVIEDGEEQTIIRLAFVPGINRKLINYTLKTEVATLWLRLCNGAVAYENNACPCNTDTGYCGCNKCVNVYSMEMVEGAEIECEEPSPEFLEEMGFETAEEYYLSKGYEESLTDGRSFIEPLCRAASFNIFGYQATCLCSYDWLFCHFANELSDPALTQMGIMLYEQAKFSGRFNDWVDLAKAEADYYLRKFNGSFSPVGDQIPGEYQRKIKLVADMMKSYLRKSGTPCLGCADRMIIVPSLP